MFGQLYPNLFYFYIPSLNYFNNFFIYQLRIDFSAVLQLCFVKQVFTDCLNLNRNLMQSSMRQCSFSGGVSILQSNRMRNRVSMSLLQCRGEVYTKSQKTPDCSTLEHTSVSSYLRHFQKHSQKPFNIFQENKKVQLCESCSFQRPKI